MRKQDTSSPTVSAGKRMLAKQTACMDCVLIFLLVAGVIMIVRDYNMSSSASAGIKTVIKHRGFLARYIIVAFVLIAVISCLLESW